MKETYFADLPTDSNYLQGDIGLEKLKLGLGYKLNTPAVHKAM